MKFLMDNDLRATVGQPAEFQPGEPGKQAARQALPVERSELAEPLDGLGQPDEPEGPGESLSRRHYPPERRTF